MDEVPAFLEGEGDPAEAEGAGPAVHAPFSLSGADFEMEECMEPVDVGAVEAELESLLAGPPSIPSAVLSASSPTSRHATPSSHHIATPRPFSPLEWVLPFFAGEARMKRRAAQVARFTPLYVGWRDARDAGDDYDEGARANAHAGSDDERRDSLAFTHERRPPSVVPGRRVVASLALVCAAAAWLYASQGRWLAVAFALFAALVVLNALALHTEEWLTERTHHRNLRALQRIAQRSADYQRVVRRVLLCIQESELLARGYKIGQRLGPISRMEANGPVQPLAAMRLRTLLRRSIDDLRSAFRAVPPASPTVSLRPSEESSAEAEGAERHDEVEAEYWNRTLAVLKQDYYALLNQSEERLDRLADVLPELGAYGLGAHLERLSELYAQQSLALQAALKGQRGVADKDRRRLPRAAAHPAGDKKSPSAKLAAKLDRILQLSKQTRATTRLLLQLEGVWQGEADVDEDEASSTKGDRPQQQQQQQHQEWEDVARHYHALGEELRRTHDEWLQGQATLLAILSAGGDHSPNNTSGSTRAVDSDTSTFEAADSASPHQPSVIAAARLEGLIAEQIFEAQTPPEAPAAVDETTTAKGGGGAGLTKREQRIAERRLQEEMKRAAAAERAASGAAGSVDEERLQLVNELKSVLALADQRRPQPRAPPPPRPPDS